MKQYDTNERMMYLNEIRISIEIENEDYSKRDELMKCLRRNYEIRFIKETLREKLAEYREKRRIESEKRREKTSVTERLAEAQKQVDQNKNNSRTVKHTGQEL